MRQLRRANNAQHLCNSSPRVSAPHQGSAGDISRFWQAHARAAFTMAIAAAAHANVAAIMAIAASACSAGNSGSGLSACSAMSRMGR